MSVMDGYEASEIIVKRIEKRIYPEMTIIGITAYNMKEKIEQAK